MTMENSSTSPRTPSAGKKADGLTLPPGAFASTDAFVDALAGELGPEYRELIASMTDRRKRQFMAVALQAMSMDSEQLLRIAAHLKAEGLPKGEAQ